MLSIYSIGHPVLKNKTREISPDYPELDKLIQQMFQTMYIARGVGLAAPQVGKSIRLFIVDATPYQNEYPETANFKKIFINPKIIKEYGDLLYFPEGCLSIPGINEEIERPSIIDIEYFDEHFQFHRKTYNGIVARIIQHEYDHLEGKLLIDRLPTLKKILLRSKIQKIIRGEIDVQYKMIFPNKKI